MIPLSSQDESFLKMESPTTPAHIGGLEIYRLPPDAGSDFMQKLYRSLRAAPVRAEPFNYMLVTRTPPVAKAAGWLKGKPKTKPVRGWEIVDVDAADHVHMHALPWPGGQRELGELVSRLHSIPLDFSRPLWEVHVIEGLEGGRYAVYTKLHHSQFDGMRGMALMKHIRSPDPKVRNLPPIWAVDLPKTELKPARKGKEASVAAVRPLDKLASWGKALSEIAEARRAEVGSGVVAPMSAPPSIFNGTLTARRRLGTQTISIERLRAIGAAATDGATVNEVLLAVIGGALRRYLKEREALPETPLVALVPVAVPRKDDRSVGNAVSQILVSLGTEIANHKQRLRAVATSSQANKKLMKGMEPEVYEHYTEMGMIPQYLASKTRFSDRVLNANIAISNVPGPREPQYVNGALVESQYSTSLLIPGQALNITAVSNRGDLDLGVLACPDLCASPQKIAVYIGEEVALLERALGLSGAAGKTASKSATKSARPAARKAPAKKAATQPVAAQPAKAAAKKPAKKAAPKSVTKAVKKAAKKSAAKPAAKVARQPRAAKAASGPAVAPVAITPSAAAE